MALSNTSNFIKDLIKAGPDAQSNLYYLKFTKFGINQTLNEFLKVRAGDFTPPAFNQTTDTKKFMTVSVDLPKPEISGEKKLSFTFRVDENYEIYQTLVDWKSFVSVSNLGYVNPNLKRSSGKGLFSVDVYAHIGTSGIGDPDLDFTKLYSFHSCWIQNLNGLTFSYDNATPLTVKADVCFLEYEDPENLLMSE